MKQLPLKDVMRHFAVTINKDGYEVTNPAGTAQYDHHGVRTTVNGIPEYFPITLAVKDKSRLADGGLIGAADLTVKPKPAEYVGQSTYTISVGQVFLCDAQVKDAVISKDILISELGKERQDYIKREVQAIIERELQAGGQLWQVTRGR